METNKNKNMKSTFKMKGYSYPGKSPVKQKIDPDAPGTPGTPGYEPPVTSMDYLTKTPNATTKAVKVDHSKTLSTHLDSRGSIKGDHEMENKGDFNISNLHKDTKISLDKKKKTNKKRSRKANEQERIEDAKGL